MVKTGITVLCLLSEAYISGYCATADWSQPVLASIGLTREATDLFGSKSSLAKEFQRAVKEATKKTADHFRKVEYRPRNLDELFEEVDEPKDLNELLNKMEQQAHKYDANDIGDVVRFFEIALRVETSNYPALARYYLLMGERINRENLEKLVRLEEENGKIANMILGDVQLLSGELKKSGASIQIILDKMAHVEYLWMWGKKGLMFIMDRLVSMVVIFCVFLLACVFFSLEYQIEELAMLMRVVVLSEFAEYFYYKKYRQQLADTLGSISRNLDRKCERRMQAWEKNRMWAVRTPRMKSAVMETLIQSFLLSAMVLLVHIIVESCSREDSLLAVFAMILGVVVKYILQALQIIITPDCFNVVHEDLVH